jgi:hypothetical protein
LGFVVKGPDTSWHLEEKTRVLADSSSVDSASARQALDRCKKRSATQTIQAFRLLVRTRRRTFCNMVMFTDAAFLVLVC